MDVLTEDLLLRRRDSTRRIGVSPRPRSRRTRLDSSDRCILLCRLALSLLGSASISTNASPRSLSPRPRRRLDLSRVGLDRRCLSLDEGRHVDLGDEATLRERAAVEVGRVVMLTGCGTTMAAAATTCWNPRVSLFFWIYLNALSSHFSFFLSIYYISWTTIIFLFTMVRNNICIPLWTLKPL